MKFTLLLLLTLFSLNTIFAYQEPAKNTEGAKVKNYSLDEEEKKTLEAFTKESLQVQTAANQSREELDAAIKQLSDTRTEKEVLSAAFRLKDALRLSSIDNQKLQDLGKRITSWLEGIQKKSGCLKCKLDLEKKILVAE